MFNSIIDAFASMNLTPTYLLVIGALIGYFRQQHAKSKVPGALNIPKDLLKSTDFNKLWTLLYVVLLPLSYLVNVFVYAVYALMWLIDIIGSVVRWSANKLYWLWSQLILGLGGFSFYVLWHYLVIWPYKLFAKMLSSFIASFNWEDNRSSYRTVVTAVLIAVGGYLLDDLLAIELFNFSDITLVAGILYVLDAVGSHMAKAMGAKAKGMRPTYAALIVTAVLVFVAESLAQDYLLLNQAAGLLGGVVLGVSVVTWLYGVIIAAAAVQFLSLVIPAYLKNDGPFNWLTALRDSFRSRWLKSIGSILIFTLAYNTLGMWIYDNVQEVTAAPYSEYTAAIEQRKADNIVALEEAVADLSLAMSTDTIDANALSSAYGDIRSIHAGNTFWSAVPNALRDVVYMEVNKPFETTDEDVEGLTALVDGHKESMATTTAALDSIIALAEGELATATARRDRVNASGITASEDGAVENGTRLRFGMPVPNDASSLKWHITDEEGDTIYSKTRSEIGYQFKSGDYQIFAAPVIDCGSGDWSSHSVSVNETPDAPAPLRMGEVRGRTDVCAGDEYTYTTAKGMEIYKWSVPAGVEILSEDENVLKVNWGTTSGEVTVMGELDGETYTTSRLYVAATGAPGVTISDEGETPEEPQAVNTVSLEYYPVTLEAANGPVDAANASLASAQANKEAYLFEANNTLMLLEASMQNGAKEVSGNMTSWLLNLLGKALLLFVMSLLLGIALNFMVVWTSKYFGGLYDMDQDGTTHFKATLTEYEGKYEGFPYVGLFTLVALIAVGSYFGYELALEYEMYLENDSWPTLMEYIGDKLP